MFPNFIRHHQFFCGKAMNEMYLSVFIMNIAESMISIFVPIYLFSLHYSVISILLFFLIGNIGNVIFALPVAKIVSKIGAKHAVLLSAPFLIIYYFGLRALPGLPWLFFVLPLGITGRALFYNFGFELNFLDHFDKKKVGGQLSTLSILSIISTVLSPLTAGLIIAYFGYGLIFIIGSILLLISTLPLFISNDCKHSIDFTLKDIVKFEKKQDYFNFISEARKLSPDVNDADFFALCLKYLCILWSNDSMLKNQDKIKVLSTEEIIELFFE